MVCPFLPGPQEFLIYRDVSVLLFVGNKIGVTFDPWLVYLEDIIGPCGKKLWGSASSVHRTMVLFCTHTYHHTNFILPPHLLYIRIPRPYLSIPIPIRIRILMPQFGVNNIRLSIPWVPLTFYMQLRFYGSLTPIRAVSWTGSYPYPWNSRSPFLHFAVPDFSLTSIYISCLNTSNLRSSPVAQLKSPMHTALNPGCTSINPRS